MVSERDAAEGMSLLIARMDRDSLDDITWIAAQARSPDERIQAILWYCAQIRDRCEGMIARAEAVLDSAETERIREDADKVTTVWRMLRHSAIDRLDYRLQSS